MYQPHPGGGGLATLTPNAITPAPAIAATTFCLKHMKFNVNEIKL